MTRLEFIASIVASLAWPATIATIVLVLRKHIDHLVPRLRSVAVSEIKAEFIGAELQKAELAADRANLPGPTPEGSDGPAAQEEAGWAKRAPFDHIAMNLQLALNPGRTMEGAWWDLRQDLTAALREEGYTGELSRAAIQEHLIDTGRLPDSVVDVLVTVESLRETMVGEQPDALNSELAARFVHLTDRVRRALRIPGIAAGN